MLVIAHQLKLSPAIKWITIIIVLLTSQFLLHLHYSKVSNTLSIGIKKKDLAQDPSLLFSAVSQCQVTVPEDIKSWMGNELVTAVQPPVEANCQLLKDGNHTEQERVLNELKNWTNSETVDEFYTKVQETECFYVKNLLSSENFYISDTERNFSLAYVILFHNSPQQIMRLLRVIYRPHNVYCLHPDGKANKTLIQAFRKMASCFDNIFIPTELVNVTYLHISTVDAQLKCYHHLFNDYQHFQWKYVSNLCGKELPIVSNRAMVEKLKELNGDSLVNSEILPRMHFKDRFKTHFRPRINGSMKKLGPRKDKVPFGIKLYLSTSYISASWQFAKFVLTSPRVKALHRYLSTALMPDEEFFATAYMLPEAPTAHRTVAKLFLVNAFYTPTYINKCLGKRVHFSCILNVLYIPKILGKDIVFFYNKYLVEYDHVVMDCMEKRIVEQNKLEYTRDCKSNTL